MNRQVVFGFIVVTLAVIAVYFTRPPEVIILSSVEDDSVSYVSTTNKTTATDSVTVDLQELKTFRGATVDGALRTDHHGNLVIDMQLRHWIDFHLTATGELSVEEIKAIMQQQIYALPQPGQQQALDLLDAYLGYLAALADYDTEEARRLVEPGISELEARFRWQQRLRREWLDPLVVEAFFGAEETIDEYTLAAQRLRKDGASEEALAALETTLPEPIRQMREQSRQIIHMGQTEAELREQGASANDIQQWRTQEYGAEAAARLARLDQQQSQWQQRIKDYKSYQETVTEQNLSTEEQDKLLQTYRNKHFSEAEQKRINAALTLLDK